ncbi:MAG: sugar transferase [Acidimicrobiia bacterium]|nr:sugar transferase [Acidimicrobiia bacterium]
MAMLTVTRPLQGEVSVAPTAPSPPALPASAYQRWIKPALDAVSAVVLLVLCLPVLLGVAVAIRVALGRGVLYRQERVGLGGRRFTIYKFRTMHHDRRREDLTLGGEDRRRTHKHPNDPRHTTLGRFLRKTSLDELPQLLNVLRGDMSLVGPRPELPSVVDRYLPIHHRRHTVKPGITGSWQVSPYRDQPITEAIGIDLTYVDSVSFVTDCAVLVKTIPAVLSRRSF